MLLTKRVIGTVAYLGGLPALLEPFAWAWGQMIQYNSEYLCQPGEIVHYDKAPVSLHDFARNTLVDRMQGEWLLQLDTDHVFDPDLVTRMVTLMDRHGLSVGVGMYRHKAGLGTPVIYQWDESQRSALPIANWESGHPVMRIGTAGGGCHLVRRAVYERIKAELKESPYARFDNLGEDHAFFKRCHKLDIPVHALLNVEAPHLVSTPLPMSAYEMPPLSTLQVHETEGFA